MSKSDLGGAFLKELPLGGRHRGKHWSPSPAGEKGVQASLSNGHPSGGIWVKAHGEHWLGAGKKGLIPCLGWFGTAGQRLCCASVSPSANAGLHRALQAKNPHQLHQLHLQLPSASSHPQRLVIFFYEDKARFRNGFTRCISLCGTPKVSQGTLEHQTYGCSSKQYLTTALSLFCGLL